MGPLKQALLSLTIIAAALWAGFSYPAISQNAEPAPPPETPVKPAVKAESRDHWTLNFTDTELTSFIQNVSQITGENYIIPPNLSGKVNILSQQPLTKGQIHDVLLRVLRSYNYTAVRSGNTVVIQPLAESRRAATQLDRDGKIDGETFITRVMPVRYTSLPELQSALTPLVSEYGTLTGLPDANAVLIADKADNVQRMISIIEIFDAPEENGMDVVQLKQNWVGSVMPLLEKLAPRELLAAGRPGHSPLRIVADERSNLIYLRGAPEARAQIRLLIARLDQPVSSTGAAQVIHLQHADAQEMATLLKDYVAGNAATPGPDGKPAPGIYIKADPAVNALIVRAPPVMVEEIRRILDQLDIRRTQVLIEAAIVEITDDLREELGIQFGAGDASTTAGLAATSLTTADINLTTVLTGLGSANTGMLSEGFTAALGGRGGFTALIKALSTNSRANLLSTPSITTVDNQEARILVGQNVPFRTGSYTTDASGATNPFTTIERKDIGITLKVTPQINAGQQITLKVEQEVSSIQEDTVTAVATAAADLITNKRTIATTILADNQETVVLGGLIRDDKTTSQSKVPVLGDIPVLGRLFQSEKEISVKRNLLVFLRPTVLTSKEDVQTTNMKKFRGIWELRFGEGEAPPLAADNLEASFETLYNPASGKSYNPPPPPLPWTK